MQIKTIPATPRVYTGLVKVFLGSYRCSQHGACLLQAGQSPIGWWGAWARISGSYMIEPTQLGLSTDIGLITVTCLSDRVAKVSRADGNTSLKTPESPMSWGKHMIINFLIYIYIYLYKYMLIYLYK